MTTYKPEYADQARKLYELEATDKEAADFFRSENFWGHMLQNLIKEVHFKTCADLMLPSAIGLAIAGWNRLLLRGAAEPYASRQT